MKLPSLVLVSLLSLAACRVGHDERTSLDATMGTDGYALFEVSNRDPQSTEMIVQVRDADPYATYALIFAAEAPQNAGWFALDLTSPRARSACAGDALAPACEIEGVGWVVDLARAPATGGTVILRSERSEDEKEHDGKKGHWSVLRVERTGNQSHLVLDVWGKEGRTGRANEPTIRQLF